MDSKNISKKSLKSNTAALWLTKNPKPLWQEINQTRTYPPTKTGKIENFFTLSLLFAQQRLIYSLCSLSPLWLTFFSHQTRKSAQL